MALFAAAIGASYVGASIWRSSRAEVPVNRASGDTLGLTPVNPFPGGTHLVAFLVVASDCGWSSQPDVLRSVRRLRTTLRDAHAREFANVSLVGIALDRDINAGLSFLKSIQGDGDEPAFDQLSVGGSWLNENLVRLIWREGAAEPSVPQIVILQRRVHSDRYLLDGSLGVEGDVFRARLVGTVQIEQWLEDGTPIQDLPT